MSKIFRYTFIVAFCFAIDKVLGVVRQVIIARQFGLSAALDAYNTANNLPDLIFTLVSGGTLALALIPVLSETLDRSGRPALWELFSHLANLVFLVTAGLSLLLALFAQPLVEWQLGIAPGFDRASQAMVAGLMRYNLLATLIFSVSGLIMAGLQANQHFILPALAAPFFDLGLIAGALILAPEQGYRIGSWVLPAFGQGAYGLVGGILLGSLLHLAIQIPGLLRYGFHWTPGLGLRHPGVRKVLYLLGPSLTSMLLIQLVFVARDNLASRLPQGTVTALTYGWLIMQVPETLIGTAVATVLLPTLAEQVTRADLAVFRQTIQRALQVILALTLPSAVLLSVAMRPLVDVLGFDPAGSQLVVQAGRTYLVGLAGMAALEVNTRAFYALQDARPPLISAVLNVSVYLVLSFLLVPRLGLVGIALAHTLTFSAEAVFLFVLFNRRIPGIWNLRSTLVRTLAGTLAGALACYAFLIMPLPALLSGMGAVAAGGLIVLPFIWQEGKLLIKL